MSISLSWFQNKILSDLNSNGNSNRNRYQLNNFFLMKWAFLLCYGIWKPTTHLLCIYVRHLHVEVHASFQEGQVIKVTTVLFINMLTELCQCIFYKWIRWVVWTPFLIMTTSNMCKYVGYVTIGTPRTQSFE